MTTISPSNLSSEHTISPSILLETSSEQNDELSEISLDELSEISLDEQNEDHCAICINMAEGEWMTLDICKHIFHRDCIMSWGRIAPKCPLCRVDAPEIAPVNPADVIILGPHLNNTELAVYLATHLGNGPNQPMDRQLLFIMRLYVITFKLFVIKWGYDLSTEAWDYFYTNGHWKDTVDIPFPSSPWSSDLTAQTSVHDNLVATTAPNPNDNLDATTERVNEACARDAAAIAGDPEAIAAVEADKIRATISDPEEMKEWMKTHPPWHASESSEGVAAAVEAAKNRAIISSVPNEMEELMNNHPMWHEELHHTIKEGDLVADSSEGIVSTIVDWWHACSEITHHIHI